MNWRLKMGSKWKVESAKLKGFADMSVKILQGDCLELLPQMAAESVDAVVCDPPYGLGFMGKEWDHGVPGAHYWREALRVAKPGAFFLAFGGTRTFHRLTCAVEDAGWELRDCIMWVYGSGFPKSHNLHGEREGWGTALKPAWEPILVARKPLCGTVAANVLKHGTGAINVDACRVGTNGTDKAHGGNSGQSKSLAMHNGGVVSSAPTDFAKGRWPANLIHDGSAEVVEQFPREAGASAPVLGTEPSTPGKNTYGKLGRHIGTFFNDSGSAARFFYCAKASREDREAGLREAGLREAGRDEARNSEQPSMNGGEGNPYNRGAAPVRNHHPTVKPTDLMRWLVRLVTPPGGVVLDPFMGSGSTGKACKIEGFDFIGIDLNAEYCEIAWARIAAARFEPPQPKQGELFDKAEPTGPQMVAIP